MWPFLMLIAAFSFAVSRLVQRSLLKNGQHDSYTYSIYFQLLISLMILPIALLNNFSIPSLENLWLQLILMTFLYGFANVFFYLAVKETPISEVMVIAATMPIWTTLTSIPFLGENINSEKILGILLAVLGVAIVFYKRSKFQIHKGHFYAFLSIILYGFALTNDGSLLRHFEPETYTFTYFFLPGVFLGLINPKKLSGIKTFLNRVAGIKFLITALFFGLAAIFINTSFKLGGQATQISVMLQLSPIFTIALSSVFLNERDNLLKKLVGGSIVVLGVLLTQKNF